MSVNTPQTAPGCMSFDMPNDVECETVLPRLGVPYNAMAAQAQALFAVQ